MGSITDYVDPALVELVDASFPNVAPSLRYAVLTSLEPVVLGAHRPANAAPVDGYEEARKLIAKAKDARDLIANAPLLVQQVVLNSAPVYQVELYVKGETCRRVGCGSTDTGGFQAQLRSADEASGGRFRCFHCGFQWTNSGYS